MLFLFVFLHFCIAPNPLTLQRDFTFGSKTYANRYSTTLLKSPDMQKLYAVYGELAGGHKSGLFIAKLDIQFNITKISMITQPQVEDGVVTIDFSSASITQDENIFVFGQADVQVDNCFKPTNSKDVFVTKVDSNLNRLWCYTLGTSRDEIQSHGVADSTGEYIYAFGNRLEPNGISYNSFIYRINPNGNSVIWDIEFGSPNIHDRITDEYCDSAAIDTISKDLFITGFIGTTNFEEFDIIGERTIFLYRINSETGEIIKNTSFTSNLYVGVFSVFIDSQRILWWRFYTSKVVTFGNVTIGSCAGPVCDNLMRMDLSFTFQRNFLLRPVFPGDLTPFHEYEMEERFTILENRYIGVSHQVDMNTTSSRLYNPFGVFIQQIIVPRTSPDYLRSICSLPGNQFAAITKRYYLFDPIACNCNDFQIQQFAVNVISTSGVATSSIATSGLISTGRITTGQTFTTGFQDIDNIESKSSKESENNDVKIIIIAFSVGALVILIVVVILVVIVLKMNMKSQPKAIALEDISPDSSASPVYLKASSENTTNAISLNKIQLPLGKTESDLIFQGNAKVISLRTVILGEIIGKGSFGIVHRGNLKGQSVAVKQIHFDTIAPVDLQEIQREALLMSDIPSHRNVLSLIGITISPDPFSLISEFCEAGSLHDYIRQHYPIKFSFLKEMIIGIALGIKHLHQNRVIHRDIATRNVLLNRELVPKVADFGMSRIIESTNTHQTTQKGLGPIRWMSPENIVSRHYSYGSDMWSFGVLIIELLTNKMPWKDYSNMEVIQMVAYEGKHHEIPNGTHPVIQKVLLGCFNSKPSGRLSPETIVEMVDGIPEK